MTKVESILQALQTIFTASLPTTLVERSRTSRFGESELPAINIKPGTDESINHAQGIRRHDFVVEFELHIEPQDVPDTAADLIIESMHTAMQQSEVLQGLVSHFEYKARQWQFADADGDALQLNVQYLFTYINLVNQL